jgi:iron(III) transport system substrate-binding protein
MEDVQMSDSKLTKPTTRRAALQAGLAIAALPLAGMFPAIVRAQSRPATKVLDFTTTADVAKAEQEGEFLFYTHDSEPAGASVVEAFGKDFPKIKGKYLRAQNGALFTKVLAERQAGRYVPDVIQFSEPATALDFQKRGGYMRHVSTQSEFYAPEHLSNPGRRFLLPRRDVRRHLLQHRQGEAGGSAEELERPAAFALAERDERQAVDFRPAVRPVVRAEETVRRLVLEGLRQIAPARLRFRAHSCSTGWPRATTRSAAWPSSPVILLQKDKGAPIAFVTPPDGLPAGTLWNGVVDKAPHPEAGKLFVDWLMSPRGQAHYQTNPFFYYGSVRKDAPPMPGGTRLRDFKLLAPSAAEMPTYMAAQETFTKEWNAMLGL